MHTLFVLLTRAHDVLREIRIFHMKHFANQTPPPFWSKLVKKKQQPRPKIDVITTRDLKCQGPIRKNKPLSVNSLIPTPGRYINIKHTKCNKTLKFHLFFQRLTYGIMNARRFSTQTN